MYYNDAGDYHAPKWISGEVRNLLKKILETEPTKRYTLENIRNHAWYGSIKENEIPKDILSGTYAFPFIVDKYFYSKKIIFFCIFLRFQLIYFMITLNFNIRSNVHTL